jgi:hypothetical protein
MPKCFSTNFTSPPEAVSPKYTTDPGEINDFIGKAEGLWDWILATFKDDETDDKTMSHLLKELNGYCGIVKDWDNGETPYSKGAIRKTSDNTVWVSKADNNSNNPSIEDMTDNDWVQLSDLRKVAITSDFTIDIPDEQTFYDACAFVSHKQLGGTITFNLTAGTYNLNKQLKIKGIADSGVGIFIKGNNAVLKSTASVILGVYRARVVLDSITLDGDNNGNYGLNVAEYGSVTAIQNTLKVKNCERGLYVEGMGKIVAHESEITDCEYGVYAEYRGYISIKDSTITSTVSDAVGVNADTTSTIYAQGIEVSGSGIKYGVKAFNMGHLDITDAEIKSGSTCCLYCATGGFVYAYRAKLTGAKYGVYTTSMGNIFLVAGEIKSNTNGALLAVRGSQIMAESAYGTGLVKVNTGAKIYSKNQTGFTYSQNRDEWHEDGVIYA